MTDGQAVSPASRPLQYSRRARSWQNNPERPLASAQRRHCNEATPVSPEQRSSMTTAERAATSNRGRSCADTGTLAVPPTAAPRTAAGAGICVAFTIGAEELFGIGAVVLATGGRAATAAIGAALHS